MVHHIANASLNEHEIRIEASSKYIGFVVPSCDSVCDTCTRNDEQLEFIESKIITIIIIAVKMVIVQRNFRFNDSRLPIVFGFRFFVFLSSTL